MLKAVTGWYFDPKHRAIRSVDNAGRITGTYGDDEPSSGKLFTSQVLRTRRVSPKMTDVPGTIRRRLTATRPSELVLVTVDFSQKNFLRHAPLLEAVYDPTLAGLVFDDGNVWHKMIVGKNFTGGWEP
jgi:hypothetical protein